MEAHPKTGAAQWVEIKETVREIAVPVYVQKELPLALKPTLFANLTDDELLGYGVPLDWLNDVRQATEDSLLLLADRLPAEASEALLELATGGKPRVAAPVAMATNPFDHPDAQRRFRVMTNVEELQRALDFPWEITSGSVTATKPFTMSETSPMRPHGSRANRHWLFPRASDCRRKPLRFSPRSP